MSVSQDIRQAWRLLRRSPLVSGLSIGALGLGIGVTVTMFTVFNAVLLRPLPYADPQQLVRLRSDQPGIGLFGSPLSAPEYLAFRANARAFRGVGAFRTASLTMQDSPTAIPTPTRTIFASPNLTSVLGTRPVLGRAFVEDDALPGAPGAALISGELWKSHFGADRQILNRVVEINGSSHRIVGVLSERLTFPPELGAPVADIWLPLQIPLAEQARWGRRNVGVIARLAPGQTIQSATRDLTRLSVDFAREHPANYRPNAQWRPSVVPVTVEAAGNVRGTLPSMLGAVALVLLVGCANVATLLLAQAVQRRREIAVRMSIGAQRLRILRQFLVEGLLLSTLGGALGLVISLVGLRIVLNIGATSLPWLTMATIDWRVVAFIVGTIVSCAILFGLVPASFSREMKLSEALRPGSRSVTTSKGQGRTQGILLFAETALAVVLLCGAGLLVRSFGNLVSVDPGFAPRGLWTLPMNTPQSRFRDSTMSRDAFRRALDGITRTPGVLGVSAVQALPLTGSTTNWSFQLENSASDANAATTSEQVRVVAPDYFETMRIPVLAGRSISRVDETATMRVVVVNKSFASKYLSGESPLGKRISFDGPPEARVWATVVGVVGDVRHAGLEVLPEPEYFIPLAQAPNDIRSVRLVVRATEMNSVVRTNIARVLREVDPMQEQRTIIPMTEIISDSVATREFLMWCLTIFAAVAFVLAAFGIFGLTTIIVRQRTGEFGIRMALGAQQSDVLRLVLSGGLRVVVIGLGAGVLASFGLSRLLVSQLYEIDSADPVTLAAVTVTMLAVAAVACYVPARRAAATDPLRVMRSE